MKIFKRIILLTLVLVLLCFVGLQAVKALYPKKYLPEIVNACNKYNIDPYLCLAVIKAESNFVSDAQSGKDAIGLMQITEPTAVWIAEKLNYSDIDVERLKEPSVNIEMGVWYLSYLLKIYNNDVTLALCAYNAGHGNVDQWLQNEAYSSDGKTLTKIPFSETNNYVIQIEKNIKIYKKLYPNIK